MTTARRWLTPSRALGSLALVVAGSPGILAQESKQESKPAPGAVKSAPSAPAPAQIDRNGVIILIRSTLLALDQANKTGNYTVMRDLGAPGFQANTDAQLAEIFAPQRRDNIDLSGVAVLDPQLTLLPQIEANGMMRMAGFFPSVPTQVNFELAYAPVNRQWRLFGVSVSLGHAAPVAPAPLSEEHPPAANPAAGKAPQAQAAPPKGAPHAQGSSAVTPAAQKSGAPGKP